MRLHGWDVGSAPGERPDTRPDVCLYSGTLRRQAQIGNFNSEYSFYKLIILIDKKCRSGMNQRVSLTPGNDYGDGALLGGGVAVLPSCEGLEVRIRGNG